jgi:hypothetical protein
MAKKASEKMARIQLLSRKDGKNRACFLCGKDSAVTTGVAMTSVAQAKNILKMLTMFGVCGSIKIGHTDTGAPVEIMLSGCREHVNQLRDMHDALTHADGVDRLRIIEIMCEASVFR